MPIGDSPERVGRLDSWFSSSSNHADVPKQVRQFLIALRAFEEDVQLLVALRNEHRSSIQLQPVILERMSNVIGTAQRVLAEIQEEMIYTSWVGRRQSPFQMLRGRSSSSSSSAVQSLARLRTLAETHHGATLAEIYRVRQIASLEPAASRSQPSMNSTQQAVDLDEMRRLAELLPTQGVSLSAPWPHLMRASPATTKAAELDASNEICRPNSRAGSHISASAPPVEMIANEDVKRDIPRIVSYKTPGWSQDESKGANNDVKSQSLRPYSPESYAEYNPSALSLAENSSAGENYMFVQDVARSTSVVTEAPFPVPQDKAAAAMTTQPDGPSQKLLLKKDESSGLGLLFG